MGDFRKGLIVGMLIIIGCGAFIASTSKNVILKDMNYTEV